jgi:hypothetical protein
MRGSGRIELLAAFAVVAAVLAAVLVHESTGTSGAATPPSPRPAAASFAAAYLGYLDGQAGSASLPGATARVRSLAAGGGTIPSASRAGALQVSSLQIRYVRGAAAAQALLRARDAKRSYPFNLGLAYGGGRWRVVYLVPPDLGTIDASPARPRASHPLLAAATRFALAYAAYRAKLTHSLPPGLPTIIGQIRTGSDPLQQTPLAAAQPHLLSLAVGPPGGGFAAATAAISAGSGTARFSFNLQQTRGAWHAWSFPVQASGA